jgi:cobalt-zinc-cadmium efflux system membrane fusion protein
VVEDWCESHRVPESECIECREELLPKSEPMGFCREHGVAECVIHHPELAQTKDPALLPKYDTVAAISVMERPENNSRNAMHASRVQLASTASFDKLGIAVDVVQEMPMIDAIEAHGELQFDPTRIGHLSSRSPGTVFLVLRTVGERVRAGDILALIDAAQVGKAKSDYLQAVVQLQLRNRTSERLKSISSSGVLPQKSWIEAESSLQQAEVDLVSARQALINLGFEVPSEWDSHPTSELSDELRFLGVPSHLTDSLPSGTKTANLVPIVSPYDGVVLSSDVVAGEVVEPSRVLFTVCDPERMWLVLQTRQEDTRLVRPGLPVRFRSDDGQHEAMGEVNWVSPTVDEQTRTVEVRVILSNESQTLREKTFGTGQIILREELNAIVVPKDAVQSTLDANFVFVRDKDYFQPDSPKFFHVRQVRLGARSETHTELLAGALPGEVVATKGSNVLLSQLLRSHLGAGCGCHDH